MAQVAWEADQPMPLIPAVRGWRWDEWKVRPHGTTAAVRRHYRHKTPLCRSCRQAQARDRADYRARRKANGGKPLGGRWSKRVAELQPVA